MLTSTLKLLMVERIQSSEHNVFFRKDFADLGGTYAQVGIVLTELCAEEKLRRIGHGIYAKTEICTVEPFVGKVILSAGITELAPEALGRLGYTVVASQAVLDYNAGISTQVPTGRRLCIQGKRTSRKIKYKKALITYEYVN
jgi:Family of unknown function (DUF6088)